MGFKFRCVTQREKPICKSLFNSTISLQCFKTRFLCCRDSPGKNTGVGHHALLQGIFPTQENNHWLLCLLHCRWIFFFFNHWATQKPPSKKKKKKRWYQITKTDDIKFIIEASPTTANLHGKSIYIFILLTIVGITSFKHHNSIMKLVRLYPHKEVSHFSFPPKCCKLTLLHHLCLLEEFSFSPNVCFWLWWCPVPATNHWSTLKGCLKPSTSRNFLGGPVVISPPFNAGGVGLILGRGAKIPHASWLKRPKT